MSSDSIADRQEQGGLVPLKQASVDSKLGTVA